MSFLSFFFEQGFVEVFSLFGGLAAFYFFLFAGALSLAARGRLSRRLLVTSLATAGLTLILFLVGLTLFEAAGLYYRVTPPGEGIQRSGKDLASFYFQVKVAFVLLYGGVIALAAGVGYVAGRRFAGAGRVVAGLSVAAMLGFLLLTFPVVEYQTSCDVGDSLFIEKRCG